jgi:uncharacterized protein YjdB
MNGGTVKQQLARLITIAGAMIVMLGLVAVSPTPAVASATPSTVAVPTARAASLSSFGVCAQAHLQDFGWGRESCVGSGIASVGCCSRKQMEALRLSVTGTSFCAAAHVQNIGWQDWTCAESSEYVEVGTTGQGLRMEALSVMVTSGEVWLAAYVDGLGWQSFVNGANGAVVTIGTTGQSRAMQILNISVNEEPSPTS